MARLVIEGMSLEQAKELADWYEGQGEQDAGCWMAEHDLDAPMTAVSRKGGWKHVDEFTETVTIYVEED